MVRRYTLSTDAEAIIGTYADFQAEFPDNTDEIVGVTNPVTGAYYIVVYSSSNDFDAKTFGPFGDIDEMKLILGFLTVCASDPELH